VSVMERVVYVMEGVVCVTAPFANMVGDIFNLGGVTFAFSD